ncbi:hypothetical protein K435DRAFT_865408 [Dendrothele bispora CBS 962.96]|uniref:Uncharacterized protein n=1 Tax=Dendrothele bispora (strain CBS 962.96) TaxID=1314807 RepID=A0A4V4HE44_DENBC|nr:hypothetical protein K435DRAFT_865408 [Dendrothele bispora CBS 962.96]
MSSLPSTRPFVYGPTGIRPLYERITVLEKPWAKPVIRELMKKNRRVSRAREEIVRCNVELRRLHTHITDEDRHFSKVLDQVQTQPIYGPVQEYVQRRRRINRYLLERIKETYDLKDFTGISKPGLRRMSTAVSARPSDSDTTPSHSEPVHSPNHMPSHMERNEITDPPCDDKNRLSDYSDSDDDDLQDNDVLNEGVSSVVDFISNLSVHG